MEVHEVMEDELWEERYRSRKWVSAAEAGGLLDHPELRDMIGGLARSLGCGGGE